MGMNITRANQGDKPAFLHINQNGITANIANSGASKINSGVPMGPIPATGIL